VFDALRTRAVQLLGKRISQALDKQAWDALPKVWTALVRSASNTSNWVLLQLCERMNLRTYAGDILNVFGMLMLK